MIKWLFNIPPEIGSKWALRGHHNDPFTRDDYTVIVLEVKKRFVQFKSLKWTFVDSLSIRNFRECYKELK